MNRTAFYFLSLLFGMFLFLPGLDAQIPRIDRVEPPNWWIGMNHNEVELMVYGTNIGYLDVETEHPEVRVTQVRKVPNRNYLFVSLRIPDDINAGNVRLDFVDGSDRIVSWEYPILDRERDPEELQGFHSADAIYLITPDRFANGDPTNDNLAGWEGVDRSNNGGRHGGDLAGIREHLDYIADMGFTAIWLNPVLENKMPSYSYHGYAMTDLYRVDPRYGTNEDYRAMVREANEKGIEVIIDLVANHIGSGHWWMKDLPTEDWVNQWEEYTQTNHQKTVVVDPYVAEVDRRVFHDGWFVPTMPDLNQRNPMLARYLIQNTIWWIEYAGFSGIRMDTYSYPDKDFMADWCRAVLTEYPNLNIVGEEWNYLPPLISYWQDGANNQDGYRSFLPAVMDFPMQSALVKSLNAPSSWQSSWTDLYAALSQDYLYPDPNNILIFPDNHDMSRIFTELNEDYASWKLAMAYMLTVRGIPQIFYGTEILMSHPGSDAHGDIRADFPGGWDLDAVNGFTGQGLTSQQAEAQAFLRSLLEWRKTASAVQQGDLLHFAPQRDDVYAFFRFDAMQRIMVILNKNEEDVTLGLDHFRQGLEQAISGRDVISGEVYDLSGETIVVPARSPLILELE